MHKIIHPMMIKTVMDDDNKDQNKNDITEASLDSEYDID